MNPVSSTRPLASLGTGKRNVPAVLKRALTMHGGFTDNAAKFPNLPIQMAAFLALVTTLQESQQEATGNRTRGAVSARNSARNDLWSAMQSLQGYAQVQADVLTPDAAAALIEAAGLVVAKTGTRVKAILTAALSATPGTVRLEANRSTLVGKARAERHVTFNWSWSTDGRTWTNAASTPYAHTEIPDLALMTTYSFRVCVTVANVPEAWSQAVTLLVH
jgi:hypothetical protein